MNRHIQLPKLKDYPVHRVPVVLAVNRPQILLFELVLIFNSFTYSFLRLCVGYSIWPSQQQHFQPPLSTSGFGMRVLKQLSLSPR